MTPVVARPVVARPVVVSLGEPAGIGPEIILKTWIQVQDKARRFVVVGDRTVLEQTARQLGLPVALVDWDMTSCADLPSDALPVHPSTAPANEVHAGQLDPANAQAVIDWIATAARLVQSGHASALVTAPIAKNNLYAAGFAFPGHTEFLAHLVAPPGTQPALPIMMLAAAGLRACLATIHVPVSQVSAQLSRDHIAACLRIMHGDLVRRFSIPAPRIAVSGLNPHAGESGTIGTEEQTLIAPAIAQARGEGINAFGPMPADSLFHTQARAGYDAVLCMYHDQALIPVKMLDFWGGVNVTLGLPIIRTSPDHGTGLDIAGQGIARPDSFIAALDMALDMAAGSAGNGS